MREWGSAKAHEVALPCRGERCSSKWSRVAGVCGTRTDEQDRKTLACLIAHGTGPPKAKLSDLVSDPLIVFIDYAQRSNPADTYDGS